MSPATTTRSPRSASITPIRWSTNVAWCSSMPTRWNERPRCQSEVWRIRTRRTYVRVPTGPWTHAGAGENASGVADGALGPGEAEKPETGLPGEVHAQGRRGTHRHQRAHAGSDGLLHQLEPGAAADHEVGVSHRLAGEQP